MKKEKTWVYYVLRFRKLYVTKPGLFYYNYDKNDFFCSLQNKQIWANLKNNESFHKHCPCQQLVRSSAQTHTIGWATVAV